MINGLLLFIFRVVMLSAVNQQVFTECLIPALKKKKHTHSHTQSAVQNKTTCHMASIYSVGKRGVRHIKNQ